MSRRAVLVFLVAGVLLAGGVVPWTVAPDRLTARVGRQLADGYGLRLTATGRTSIAFLPVPRIKFDRVSLTADDGRELVGGAVLRGEIRVLPLLGGRVELGDLSLTGGRIRIERDETGRTNWDAPVGRLVANALAGSHDELRLRRLSVTGTEVDLVGPDTEAAASLRVSNLLLSWPQPGSGLDMVGTFGWRSETVEATVSVPRPLAILRGGRDRVEARVSSRALSLSADGELGSEPAWRFAGATTAAAPSLGRALALVGGSVPLPVLDRVAQLSGEAVASGGEIAWAQMRLDLGGDRLDGALAFGLLPPFKVRATLAADRLDLGWLLPSLPPAFAGWAFDPAGTAALDLRLSASAARVGPLRIGDAAVSLLAAGGRMDASLLRAEIEGGLLKGRVTAVAEGGRADIKAQTSFEKIDLAALSSRLGRRSVLSGTARGQANLEATGAPADDLVQHLQGRASGNIRNGEFAWPPFAASAPAPDWPAGRMAFDEAGFQLNVVDGVAEIVDARTELASARLSLAGSVSLAEGRLDLRATAERPGGDALRGRSTLEIVGPWDVPTVQPVGPDTGANRPTR